MHSHSFSSDDIFCKRTVFSLYHCLPVSDNLITGKLKLKVLRSKIFI